MVRNFMPYSMVTRLKAAPHCLNEVSVLPVAGTEAEQIRRASEGSPEAFEQLVRKYQRYVYNLALSVVGNRDDAFDVAQETFVRAWRGLGDFRGEARFSTWLYRIAYRVSLTAMARRRDLHLDDLPEFACSSAEWDPEEAADRELNRRLLRQALMGLSPPYRTALVLYHMEGLSYEEIASVTGVPIGTVRTHLHRGREILRRELERLSGGEMHGL